MLHIDMNWMWGFQETAALTVDTFRTMLELMERYPDFTFSQSQASVYHILETYYPAMLEEIRRRVRKAAGKSPPPVGWKTTKTSPAVRPWPGICSTPGNTSRNFLDIPQEQIQLDFEPDTFGHCENLPEILHQGGIRYYYHCRGAEGPYLYRWRAPPPARRCWLTASRPGTTRPSTAASSSRYRRYTYIYSTAFAVT